MVRSDEYFTLRVVAFLALVVGVNLWLDHHRGIRLADTSVMSMISAALAGGLGLLTKLLSDPEKENLATRAAGVTRVVFWTPLLVVAWSVALILGLTLSSVTVVAETQGTSFKAAVVPDAVPRAPDTGAFRESASGILRMPVPTNPLGRAMRVTVPGYVPLTLDVYPLVGRRIVLGSDMRPSPSVLLRLPFSAHGLLGDGTRLVVRLGGGGQSTLVAETTTRANRSGYLLGRRREVPPTLRRDWELDLEADRLTRNNPETSPLLAMMLKEWRHPVSLETQVNLEPGMTLVAELIAPAGAVAVATVALGPEPFQDVALRDPKE